MILEWNSIHKEALLKIWEHKSLLLFLPLKESPEPFNSIIADRGGYGIVWNDDIDISCDELWSNGIETDTPFDCLMAFSGAAFL